MKKQIKNNNNKLPSPSEIKAFAAKYSKDEWDYLCECQEFLDIVLVDVKEAKQLATALILLKALLGEE